MSSISFRLLDIFLLSVMKLFVMFKLLLSQTRICNLLVILNQHYPSMHFQYG